MKRIFALLILIAALSGAATAQTGVVLFREGDAVRGHVRAVRSERVWFSELGGEMVEGARVLYQTIAYTPDGRRCEIVGYERDGSVRVKYVHVYDENGRRMAIELYNRSGLTGRILSEYDSGGRLLSETTYGPDGAVRQKKVMAGGNTQGSVTYAANGSLIQTEAQTLDAQNNRSVGTVFRQDGTRASVSVNDLHYDQPIRHEEVRYNQDGSVAGRRVVTGDRAVSWMEITEYDGGGALISREREEREYDDRHNLIKLTRFKWDSESGSFKPYVVSYHAITYYED